MSTRYRRVLESYLRLAIRYDWLIALFTILVTVVFAFPTVRLYSNISTALRSLLPDDYPSVRVLDRANRLFESRANVVITFEIGHSHPQTVIAMMQDLKGYYEKYDDIEEAAFEKKGFDYFDRRKWLYLQIDELKNLKERIERRIEQEKLGDLYIDFEAEDTAVEEQDDFSDLTQKYGGDFEGKYRRYHTDKEARLFSFYLFPKEHDMGLGEQNRFLNAVVERLQAFPPRSDLSDLKVHVAGNIKTKVDEYRTLMADLRKAGFVSLGLVCLVLAIYFRRFWAVVLLNLMLIQSVVWTFACVSVFVSKLNIITSFLFSILFGIGVDIGIHLLARYREERLLGKSCDQALLTMLLTIVKPSLFAVGSTAFCFFLLTINDFKGFSEFGLIAGFGLLISLILYVAVLPAYVHLLERKKLLHWSRANPDAEDRFKQKLFEPYPRPKLVVGIGIGLAILILMGIPRLNFEYDFKKIKAYVGESQFARKKFRETLVSIGNPAMVLFQTELEGAAIEKAIDVQKTKVDHSTIEQFRSYSDLIPEHQEEKLQIVKEILALFDDDALKLVKGDNKKRLEDFKYELKRGLDTYVIPTEIPEVAKKKFFAQDGTGTQVGFIEPLKNLELDDGRNAIRFRNEVHTLHTDEGTFHASSDAIIFAEVLLTLLRDSKVAVVLSILAVVILVWLDVGSLKLALFLLIPLLSGVFLMCGIMGWFNLSLNFYNIIVFPALFGMGEDTAVYFYHRFLEERTLQKRGAVRRMLRTAGTATGLSMMTTVFGFFGLAIAEHQGLRSIGIAAIIGLVACYLVSVLPFAAGLELYGAYLDKKEKPNVERV